MSEISITTTPHLKTPKDIATNSTALYWVNPGKPVPELSETLINPHRPLIPHEHSQRFLPGLPVHLWGLMPMDSPWNTAERNIKNPRTRTYASFVLSNSGFDEVLG